MSEERLIRIERLVEAIQESVVRIQESVVRIQELVVRIEVDHGQKLDALFDAYQMLKEGQQELSERVDRLEESMTEMKGDVREIKHSVGLLHSVANDHERRLQRVENAVQDHLRDHP